VAKSVRPSALDQAMIAGQKEKGMSGHVWSRRTGGYACCAALSVIFAKGASMSVATITSTAAGNCFFYIQQPFTRSGVG
jgi:hypothetical protein